jgi:hypothetical protein
LANEALVLDTSLAAAAFWALVGGVDGTGAMTIPLLMTVVFFTLEQIGDLVDVAAPLDPDDPPDMFIPGIDPLMAVVEVVDLAALFIEAPAAVTGTRTRTPAVVSAMAPIHPVLAARPTAVPR